MTFRFSATDPAANDIGPVYDVGISTRDGSTLSCLDRNGKPQLVSQIAYMLSIDKQGTFEESTELQEKDKLVQLGTGSSMDREWDQWVQNTQGDWSGGLGQRVYNKDGITNQYFDGQGLLWPLNDYVPQVPLPQVPVTAIPGGALTAPLFRGIAGGYLANYGNGYAKAYGIVNGANWDLHVRFYSGDNFTDLTLIANTKIQPIGLFVALGFIWVLTANLTAGVNIQLYKLQIAGGVLAQVDAAAVVVSNLFAGSTPAAVLTAVLLGNRMYVAVGLSYQSGAATFVNQVTIYDCTAGSATAGNSSVLPFPSTFGISVVDLNFQGGQLYVSLSDGFNSSVIAVPPPFAAPSTVAVLPGLARAYMSSVGSVILIVAWSQAGTGQINRVDLYTLESGGLVEIGPLVLPAGHTPVAISSPLTFDGYAIWSITCSQASGQYVVDVYALDVPRTRLFRAISVTKAAFVGNPAIVHTGFAVYGAINRTINTGTAGTYLAQWGFALDTESLSGQVEFAEEFYFGVLPLTPAPTFAGLLQMGSDLTTGLFDFTAGSNKLFRQLVATFINGLIAGVASPLVTISSWFDQDPGQLAAAADFTTNTNTPALPVAPLPQYLNLVTNKIARKVVGRVITTGGGFVNNAWINSPKLVDLKVQAATGWVWDGKFLLSPNATTNAGPKGDYAYAKQSDPTVAGQEIDQVVAYNFLRQLWRLKGGQCTISLPNLDNFPALLQLLKFSSPKPFAASVRSDVQAQWQETVTVKIREDI